jgi:N utilization substance protein A
MVVNELRGEKIDVVPWSADPGELVANALQPAKVKEVRIDPDTQTALVVVPDYQLSLAIGKEGQNARLAARLTGWRIDIKSESQAGGEPVPPRPASAAAAPETIAVAQTAAVPEAVAVSETIAVPETDATEEVVIAQEEAETATEAIDELALEEVAVAAIDEAVAEESEAPVGE